MKLISAWASLVLVAVPATAAEQKLSSAEITAALSDQVLSGENGASQIFQKSGVTYYSQNGGQSQGFWKVADNRYCSQWPPNESWPCYDVLRDGTKIIFVSSSGTRSEMQLPGP